MEQNYFLFDNLNEGPIIGNQLSLLFAKRFMVNLKKKNQKITFKKFSKLVKV